MNNFNPPQIPLDNNLDLKHTSDSLNQTDTINPKVCPITTPIVVNEPPPSTSAEISVTSDNDQATSRDWFNLARKLREQNRELLESIVKLEQSLAESQQQSQEKGQQAHRNDFLITQKTAQVDAIKAQFETAQKQLQQQQQELNILQEKLVTTQSQLTHVEHQCTLLKQRYREKADRLEHSQKQIEELQTRLQRQQRYTLQYKAALDECLSKSTKKQVQPSINSFSSTNTFNPKINSIKTWSEQLTAQKASGSILANVQSRAPLKPTDTSKLLEKSEPLSSLGHSDLPLQDSFSLAPKIPEAVKHIKTDTEEILNQKSTELISANFDPKTVAKHDVHSHKMVTPTSQELAVQPPVTFSFDIDCNKPHDKAKIDLPSFLSKRN
ncbi:hypothetical protein RGRSB_0166 [cyanobacterium endosymbiont of Rhopalodia gibberula]|uniref:hypothetical protein n=1 Tax=cyanobacterium endosymbiont of Rhopalodia gibberula TaxID=1763363 RepID=UPI000DC73AAA|nr:hypothetical protein [cyanobacterium endosymbiont of Rhopalodia gibberula]BBA78785.1 hypothetical protein RGRSB_0166 [cyanobacterium endosymbiont of Rhopalodia gibberula]